MEEAVEACCGRSERTEIAPPTVRRHSRYGATDHDRVYVLHRAQRSIR